MTQDNDRFNAIAFRIALVLLIMNAIPFWVCVAIWLFTGDWIGS